MAKRVFCAALAAAMLLTLLSGLAVTGFAREAAADANPAHRSAALIRPLGAELADSQEDIDVYFVDETHTENPHVFYWNTTQEEVDTEEDLSFPGEALNREGLAKNGHPYYKITLSRYNYDMLLFNNGIVTEGGANPANQTQDLDYVPEVALDPLDEDGHPFVVFYVYYENGDMRASTGEDVWPADSAAEVPAGCEEGGYTAYTGLRTGVVIRENETPAIGHAYGAPSYEWTEITDGFTCTGTVVCANDPSHVITETVTASYAVTTAPTATAPGVGTYTAAFTGEFFTTQTKDVELPAVTPAEPIYDSALKLRSTVTADIQMRVNFYANKSVVENYSKFWIEVTMAGETLRYELEGENALTYVANRERYYAYYYGVNATQMAETVSAVLYAEDANGQVYCGNTASTCVRDILLTILTTSTIDEQCRMAADMLVYGGEAQRYFGSNQTPVDENLTETQMAKLNAYRTNTDPELTQDNATESDDSGVRLGMTVSLQSCVELRLTVRSLSTDKPVQIVVKDHGTHEIVDVLDAAFNGTNYKATYTGIGASGAHTQFEFRARTVDGEDSYTEIGQTQIWSLEGLAKGKKDSTVEQDQKLYTLAMAVLKYSDSVGIYLQNSSAS